MDNSGTYIGLNLLAVRSTEQIGVETFARRIVGNLKLSRLSNVDIVLRKGVNTHVALGQKFFKNNPRCNVRFWFAKGTIIRIIKEMILLSLIYFGKDVILSINNFGPLIGKKSQKRIVIVHDVWFLSDRYEGSRLGKMIFRTLISLQLKTTHKIITVSEFSKKELIRRLGVDPEDIDVVPNCLPKSESTKVTMRGSKGEDDSNEKAPRRYFLLVGADRKNKNVSRAIAAFVAFKEQAASAIQLIVVGSYSQNYLGKLRETYGPIMDNSIRVEGYVSRDRYQFLLRHAEAVVFPSLYEGYGIPVIEAIAANKPVLVSSGTVCEETAGALGVAVDGTDVMSIQEGYRRLAAFDSSASSHVVENFKKKFGDCDGAAKKLREIIETVLGQ